MKKEIHPTYNPKMTITCACGNIIKTGSTSKDISVEICADCHPFFSGKEKLIDTAGRVEKFKQKVKKTKEIEAVKKEKKTRAPRQNSLDKAQGKSGQVKKK